MNNLLRSIPSQVLLSVYHSLDTVVHVLDEVNLREAESSLVGDIIDSSYRFGVLTVDTSDVAVVLISDGIELVRLRRELGKFDVNGSSHASTQVGGAGGDVAEMLVVSELGNLLDLLSSDRESLEDLTDVGALLHRDNTELVFFVNPDKEGLVVVVVDTTCLGPITLKSAGLEILVVTLEQEVIIDELSLFILGHASERIILASKFTVELGEGRHDLFFDFSPLLSGNSGTERVVSEVSSDSNTGRVDHGVFVSWEVGTVKFSVVHV